MGKIVDSVDKRDVFVAFVLWRMDANVRLKLVGGNSGERI
jgi:hypothetical protein